MTINGKEILKNYGIHFLLFLLILLTRIPYLFDIDIAYSEWDTVTRMKIAFTDYQSWINRTILPSHIWLPIPFYIIRFFKFFSTNLNIYLYFNIFLNILTYIIIYHTCLLFAQDVYKRILSAILCFLFSLVPVLYFIGLTNLSEPLFMFFIALSVFYFFKSNVNEKFFLPFFIFLNFANLVRYESWIMTLFLGLAYFFLQPTKKNLVKISLFSIVPILWTLQSYVKFGDPLYWANIISQDANDFYKSSQENFLILIFKNFLPTIYLTAIFLPSVFHKKFNYNKSIQYFGIVTLSFSIIFLGKFILGGAEPYLRYNIAPLFFLGLFFIYNMVQNIKFKSYPVLIIALFGFAITNLLSIKTTKSMYYPLVPPMFYKGVEKLKKIEFNQENKLLLPRIEWFPELIVLKLNKIYHPSIYSLDIDEQFAFNPRAVWAFYEKQGYFNQNSKLRYMAFPKGQRHLYDLKYSMPTAIRSLFRVKWENAHFEILERI